MARCAQRYADWAHRQPDEEAAAGRAETALEDCIESEP
jgi:hypothetical protein